VANPEKAKISRLSGCRLMLRQEPGTGGCAGLSGLKVAGVMRRSADQPLVPAAFFACGAKTAPHVG
jgi:hypothetical protein